MFLRSLSRPFAAILLFFASIFGLGVVDVLASHFRGGAIYWMRDLTYVSSTHYKFRVTILSNMRWTYQDHRPGAPPISGLTFPTGHPDYLVRCASVVGGGATGTYSCPPKGALIEVLGGLTSTSGGGLTFDQPFTLVGRHGYTLLSPQVFTGVSPIAKVTLPLYAIVDQVVPTQDALYAISEYDILLPKTSPPLTIRHMNANRLSAPSLLDGNGDSQWQMQTTIDVNSHTLPGADGAVATRSPISTSLPVIQVRKGQQNIIPINTVAYDNFTNQVSIPPTAETQLFTTQPSNFALNQSTGIVTFTPPAVGFYATQFKITSYDSNGVARSSVPLELLFQSTDCGTACPTATISQPSADTAYTSTVGQLLEVPVSATVGNTTSSGTLTISTGPLPPGMTFQQSTTAVAPPGTPTVNGMLRWTPVLGDPSRIVCLQATFTIGFAFGASSTPRCLTFNPGAVATTLTLEPIPQKSAGDTITARATLRRTANATDNTPLPLKQVQFAWQDDPANPIGTVLTDSNGVATLDFQLTRIAPAGRTLTATFTAIANEFLQSAAASTAVIIKGNTTTLDALVFGPVSIGYPLPVSAVLRPVAVGAVSPAQHQPGVVFTITGPGVNVVIPGTTTDALGVSTLSQPFVPAGPGPFTVVASFPGNDNLFGLDKAGTAATSVGSATALRRVKLVFTPIPGPVYAGTSTTTAMTQVVATVLQLPELTVPLANRLVTIDYGAGAVPVSNTGNTDAAGRRAADVHWTTTGAKTLSASYTPLAGEANDQGFVAPETEAMAVTVSPAATALAYDFAAVTGSVNAQYLASAFLSRTSPIAAPIAGATLTFQFFNPAGTLFATKVGVTDAAGRAVMTSPAPSTVTFNVAGTWRLQISATPGGVLAAPTSLSRFITVTNVPSANVVIAPVAAVVGVPTTIAATFLDAAGNGIPNLGGISFTPPAAGPGFTSVTTPTNGAGQAFATFTAASIAQGGSYTVSYDGSGIPARTPTSATSTITIRKANTLTTTLTANQTIGRVATEIRARLFSNEGSLVVMPGRTITFVIQPANAPSVTLSATTNGAGVATTTFTPTSFGVHTVTPSFAGEPTSYEASSGSAVTLNVTDPTPPVIIGTVTGSQGADGWYTGATTISWSVTDPESTIGSTVGCNPVNISDQGALSFNCQAVSEGGSSSQLVTLKRDSMPILLTTPDNISQTATAATGNIVNYPPPAAVAGSSGVSSVGCLPASGSLFGLGSNTVSCTATNGAGVSLTKTFTISITNNAPTANGDSATTDEDTAVTVNVLGNDTDVENNALTPALVGSPARGTIALNPNGTFTYTPNANVNGGDSFSYKVNDGVSDSAVATVAITINPVNDAPTANALAVVTDEDSGGQAITLTGADIDSEGLEFVVVSPPQNGTLSGSGANLVYTPNPNFFGPDGFAFGVSDGLTASEPASVLINVLPVNDPPIAVADAATTNEDTAVSGNVLGNDGDLDSLGLSANLISSTSNGSVVLLPTGEFTYTPNPNFHGTDSFRYSPHDGQGFGNDVAVTITVNPVNDAPTASGASISLNEDAAVSGSLGANDLDGNTLTYALVGNGAKGNVVVNAASGAFTYTANANANGADSFTFQVTDGTAASNVAIVTVDIVPVNDAPTSADGAFSTDEDAAVNGTLSGADTDSAALTYSIVSNGGKGSATVTNASTGAFTYTPNANANGVDTFTFKVSDGGLDSGTATVTISINALNDAPTATGGSVTTDEDTPAAGSLSSNDLDGDAVTYSVVSNGTKGSASVNPATGVFTYTPNANANGSDSFSFLVNDGNASSNVATITVTINAVNDAPTTADGALSTDEDTAAAGSLSANDLDGNAVTYSIVANGTKGTASVNAATGAFSYTPNVNANGSDSFTFKVTDGSLESNTSTVTVTINAINDAPTTSGGSASTNEDAAVSGSLSADDLDGNALTYTVVADGAKGTALVNPSTGAFTYTPNPNANGADSFSFQVTDGNLTSNVSTITVSIAPVNDTPVATAESASTDEDNAVSGNVLANDTDIDNDALTAVLATTTANGTLVLNAGGAFVYTPNANFNGTDAFTYMPNDGTVNGAAVTVTLTVNAINDAPTTAGGSASTDEDAAVSGSLSATDIDANALTYAIVSNGAKGTAAVNPATGEFTYTPNANANGSDEFTFQVTDGTANSNVSTINISIAPVNDSPVATAESASTDEDNAVSGNVLANDGDIDNNPLTAVLGTSTANGTLVLNANGDYTYTPNANFNGSDAFTYMPNDGTVNGAAVTVSLTINAVNDAPTTATGSLSTNEDAAASGSLSASDIDANPLTYSIVTNGSQGSATITNASTGAFTYTPNANANGADSFTFQVTDGTATSNVSTVTVSIAAVNDAPTASAQSVSTNEDNALAVALGANDIDADTLSYTIVSGPAHGTLTGSGASRSYMPAANYNGPDSFTFRVNDGSADSNIATVTIGVDAVNDAPVAANDAATTNANTAVNGAVLGNDTDIEGTTLTASVVTAPAHGTVTLNANGTYTFTPALDYSGADSFTYRASDGAAFSNVATVSLTIQSVAQVAAQTQQVVTAVDPGLSNDVAKITGGNPKNNCQDAAKLIDRISKSNKYTAAEKATMIASVQALAASIPCTP